MAKSVGLTYRFEEKAKPYRSALRAAGLGVIDITPGRPRTLDGLDGLVVSGGTDLDSSWYGQPRHPLADEPDVERDNLEWDLIMAALAADLPLFCICRGLQLFNVAHRGSLHRHLDNAATHVVRPPPGELHLAAHKIVVEPGTVLASIIGAGEHEVNSRHHQAVDRLGESLEISARSPDGVIEAVERKGKRFAVAVQWHPEDRVSTSPMDRQLFEAFAAALSR